MSRPARNDRGFALVTTLLLLTVIASSIVVAISFTVVESRAIEEKTRRMGAFNLAEAGLQEARFELSDHADPGEDGEGNIYSEKYSVDCAELDSLRRQLTATAAVEGYTVSLREIVRKLRPIDSYAVYGHTSIHLGSWARVETGYVGNGDPTVSNLGIRIADHCAVRDGIIGEGPLRFASNSGVDEAVENADFGAITVNREVWLANDTHVGGDVNVGGDARFADDSLIDGDIIAGGFATLTGGAAVTPGHSVTSWGTPKTFDGVELPETTTPEPGLSDVIGPSTAWTPIVTTIAPGNYKDARFPRFSHVKLRSGSYHFRDYTAGADNAIFLDLTNGPISIYCEKTFWYLDHLRFFVSIDNGTTWHDPFNAATSESIRDLAGEFWVEAHGVNSVNSSPVFAVGHHSQWFGVAYVPCDRNTRAGGGADDLTMSSDCNVRGSLLSTGWIQVAHRTVMNTARGDAVSSGSQTDRFVREAWLGPGVYEQP